MRTKTSLSIREGVIFAMLAAIMFVSKLVMELLPNMHLLACLVIVYTLVYRLKALIPIYLYVLINGVYSGFAMWWIPYLYVWTLLWGAVMLLPRRMPERVGFIVYPILAALHGFAFGVLYAPMQALMYGLNFEGMLAWVAAGLPFDLIHGVSNFAIGFLILPLTRLLRRLSGVKADSGEKSYASPPSSDIKATEAYTGASETDMAQD